MVKNGIYSKWLIKGLDGFCYGSDKVFYKLPFKSGKNYYGIKAIKKQYPNRYRINQKEWISEKQLKSRIYLNPKPELLIESKNDFPF